MSYKKVPFLSLLSEIVDNRGKTCPTATNGIPLIATNCIKNENFYPTNENIRYVDNETYKTWFRGHPVPGDIIFVTKGSPGQTCWVPDPVDFCIAQDMVSIRVNEKSIYPKYLFALLRSKHVQKQIENMHVGTLIPHFKKGDFDKLILDIDEDYEVQKGIGDMYFILSEKIELNLKMNKTLEAIAQAIFKEWFIDFRFPGFDGGLVDGLPKGWREGRLGEDFKLLMGQSPPGESYNEIEEGTVFYQGRTDFGFRFPENRIYTTDPNRMAKKLDTLVSVRAPVGDINMALEDCCIGRGLSAVRHISGAYSYTYYAMKSVENIFKGFEGEGTVFGSINKTNFENISTVIPDKEVIEEFEKYINPIDEKILNNSNEIKILTKIRDILLPKLMTGKIRVKT
jgi:type I restriction enzyme S subunit